MLLEHVLEHDRPPPLGRGGVEQGVERARVGDHAREQRRLVVRELRRARRPRRVPAARVLRARRDCRVVAVLLAEVHARRGLDAVRAVAEVDRVQVLVEDLRPRPPAREVVGQRGLAQLLEDRAVVLLGQRVLDELLGDRRGALPRAAGDVGQHRARDASQVDPGVGPESPILDRDDRAPHIRRDLLEAVDRLVIGRGEQPDQVPVVVVQVRVRRGSVHLPVLDLRQVLGDRHHHPEHGRDDRQHAQADQDQQQPELAHPRLGWPARATAASPTPAGRLERDRRLRLIALCRGFDVVAHAIAGCFGGPRSWPVLHRYGRRRDMAAT